MQIRGDDNSSSFFSVILEQVNRGVSEGLTI